MTEAQVWQDEYKSTKDKQKLRHFLNEVYEAYYQHKGHFSKYYDNYVGNVDPNIDEEAIAYAHTTGLADLDMENNIISLTSKGKFFINEYLKSKN